MSHPSPRVAVVVSAMWPPAGRIRAECPSSSLIIRNQRHPQRHPHRNCLVRRYGETRQNGPIRSEFRRSHQIGAGVWTISVPLWRSRSGESPRRPWRARCPPGRLSRSPTPMPPFRRIATTSGQRARTPHTACSGLDSGPAVARLDAGERLMRPARSQVLAAGPAGGLCSWQPMAMAARQGG